MIFFITFWIDTLIILITLLYIISFLSLSYVWMKLKSEGKCARDDREQMFSFALRLNQRTHRCA